MNLWTDAMLAADQKCCGEPAERELYRLARLGLAAEQVGLEGMERSTEIVAPEGLDAIRRFIAHPAWRDK